MGNNDADDYGVCPLCECQTLDGETTDELDYCYPTCPLCGASIMDDREYREIMKEWRKYKDK
jgi:hypothetical protein